MLRVVNSAGDVLGIVEAEPGFISFNQLWKVCIDETRRKPLSRHTVENRLLDLEKWGLVSIDRSGKVHKISPTPRTRQSLVPHLMADYISSYHEHLVQFFPRHGYDEYSINGEGTATLTSDDANSLAANPDIVKEIEQLERKLTESHYSSNLFDRETTVGFLKHVRQHFFVEFKCFSLIDPYCAKIQSNFRPFRIIAPESLQEEFTKEEISERTDLGEQLSYLNQRANESVAIIKSGLSNKRYRNNQIVEYARLLLNTRAISKGEMDPNLTKVRRVPLPFPKEDYFKIQEARISLTEKESSQSLISIVSETKALRDTIRDLLIFRSKFVALPRLVFTYASKSLMDSELTQRLRWAAGWA